MSSFDVTIRFNGSNALDNWRKAGDLLLKGSVGFRFQDHMDCFGEAAADCLEELLEKFYLEDFKLHQCVEEGTRISWTFDWPASEVEAMLDHYIKFLTLCGATEINAEAYDNSGD